MEASSRGILQVSTQRHWEEKRNPQWRWPVTRTILEPGASQNQTYSVTAAPDCSVYYLCMRCSWASFYVS